MVLDARGPLHDRRWLVIDADSGAFLTQREHPLLATVDVAVQGADVVVSHDRCGQATLRSGGEGPLREVLVWKRARVGRDAGDVAAAWFSELLGHSVRCLADAGAVGNAGEGLAFADGYPLLVTTRESLEDLNQRLEAPLGMERFRPNLVIEGAPAWTEDGWGAIRVGDLSIELVKACARCVVINTDQRTGEVAPEPLRALAGFRRRGSDGAMFGVNGVHSGPGTLRVGMAVASVAR